MGEAKNIYFTCLKISATLVDQPSDRIKYET